MLHPAKYFFKNCLKPGQRLSALPAVLQTVKIAADRVFPDSYRDCRVSKPDAKNKKLSSE